ncbi:sodium channel protein Nach-like [Ostrinia furnacalis]|uniref:sodium channel protein Nach-like n=1 Tax=Ostrinia furnacalis TaxID=93504 RepID=UPI0010398745|nr:sodium channel protein Nach-like [Ostrinia furnacalis]
MVYYPDKPLDVKEAKKHYADGADKKRLNISWTRKFVEFSKRTDLHGYKYIVMEDLNVVERSCWAVAVLASICVAIYFVVTAYKWYARNPIITVIESTQGAIWDVPFPAVTICDLNIVSRKSALSFSKNVTLPPNVTVEFVYETVRLAPLLHATYVVGSAQKRDLKLLQKVLDLNNISMEKLFRKLSPVSSCNQLLERCMWKNTVYRCDKLFYQVFTLQNLCCAFNYFALDNPDKQIKSPRRVASCGYQTALTVLVQTDPGDYYSAHVASQGAFVYIDDAYNAPDLDSSVRLVNPSSEVMIALSPERTYSTPGLKAFTTDYRKCYYKDEVTQLSLSLIPPARTKRFSRSCNFNDIDCLENVLRFDDFQNFEDYGGTVNCLPECEHFNYHFEVALGSLAKKVELNGHPFFKDVKLENHSLVNIFFNDLVSTKYRRDVYLNWQNLLAAFGGLMSLILGFTLISGFDLILFIIFRVVFDVFSKLLRSTDNDVDTKYHKGNKINQQNQRKQWLEPSIKKIAPKRW